MKPVYTHDCDKCQFLGSVTIDGKTQDLYYCAVSPTIIARYSSEGSNYSSGMCFGAASLARAINGEKLVSKALMVAYTLAMANGFNVTDEYGKSIKQILDSE